MKARMILISAAFLPVCFGAWILFGKVASRSELKTASQNAALRPAGQPQLISVKPLPQMEEDGEMCQWVPASATTTLAAASMSPGDNSASAVPISKRPIAVDNLPERVIHDPNPAFSAVGVDPDSNMVVVTDENLFQVLQYNRMDNTPKGARMTEPKRVIGGDLTKAEMICGVYIDPKTLDTYVVNNDTQNWMAVFSKNARGNVAPDRYLAVPHGTFGIAVDESSKEIYLTVEHDNSIVVYNKYASGKDKPLRKIVGDDTHLEDPHGIAIDTQRNLLVVANQGSVSFHAKAGAGAVHEVGASRLFQPGSGRFDPPSLTIYPLNAKGDVRPLRIIAGSRTELNWPAGVAVDSKTGEIYVADDMKHAIVVFKVSDSGNVAPTRIIKGTKTGLKNPLGIALDTKHHEVWVADMGDHTASVFSMAANGNVAPLRAIRGGPASAPALMIANPGAVGYDTKREQILVPN